MKNKIFLFTLLSFFILSDIVIVSASESVEYHIVNFDKIVGDDVETLGLWHLDGNLEDSSSYNNSSGVTSLDYTEGYFNSSISIDKKGDIFTLYLDNCGGLSISSDFTLEFYFYFGGGEFSGYTFPNYSAGSINGNRKSIPEPTNVKKYMKANEWNHVMICRDMDSSVNQFYINGNLVKLQGTAFLTATSKTNYGGVRISESEIIFGAEFLETFTTVPCIGCKFDEIRLTKGNRFSSDFQVPLEPYSDDKWTFPQSASENDIGIKSDIECGNYQIGGVVSDSPNNGDVFVLLDDNNCVLEVQQFQDGNWVSVDSMIYRDLEWVDITGLEMKLSATEKPTDGTSSSESDGTGSGDSEIESESGTDEDIEEVQPLPVFSAFMAIIIDFLKYEFTVYGFTFSFWQILIFTMLCIIVCNFIRGFSDV